MNEKLGPVDIEFVLKSVNFSQEAGKLKAEITGIRNTAQKEVDETNRIFQTLGRGIAAYFSFNAIKGFGSQLISVRGEFEMLGVAMETMLQSKEKADRLMADVVELAAITPFGLTQVGNATKQLLAYQEPLHDVIETTRRLGDISAGLNVPVEQLVAVYGKVRAQNRLMGQEMLQFMKAGIPMTSELARHFGIAEEQVAKMVETGQVGFEDVRAVLHGLTNEGGMFFNLMEKESKTLTGMISNLGDAWDRMLNDIGEGNEGLLKGGVSALTTMVENYETILDILKVIIITYGTYRAAIIAVSVTEKIRYQIKLAQMASTKQLTTLEALHAVVLGKVKDAQALLNKTMLANPYVAVAALIAGVASALVVYSRRASEADESQRKLAEATIRAGDELAKEKAKIETLLVSLNSENASRAEKERAIKELNSIAPEYLGHLDAESVSTREGKAAIDAYIESLKTKLEIQELEREMGESISRQNAAKRGDLEKGTARKLWEQLLISQGFYAKVALDGIDAANKIIEKEGDLQDKIRKRIEELLTKKTPGKQDGGAIKTIKDLEAELAELERKRKESTDISDKSELEKLKKLIIAKRQEIEKFKIESEKGKTDLEHFQEDLKRKAELYKQYEAYKKAVGEEEAAAMYEGLVRQGSTYLSYLTNLINTLPAGEKKAIVALEWVSNERKANGEEAARLEELLRDTATHNQKLLALDKQYQKDKSLLISAGAEENVGVLTENYKRERQALEEANALKSESYKWVYESLDRMSRNALKDYIARLKEEVKAKAWSDEAKLMLSQKLAEAEQKLADKLPDTMREVSGLLRDAAGLAREFDENLADAIDTAAELANSVAGIAAGLASGNYFQVASGIITGVTALVRFFKKQSDNVDVTQRLTEEINRMNEALERQLKLIAMAAPGTERLEAYQRSMSKINDQLQDTERQLFDLMRLRATGETEVNADGFNRLGRWAVNTYMNTTQRSTLREFDANREIQQILGDLNLSIDDIIDWSDTDWLNVIERASGDTREQLELMYDQWAELKQQQEEYYRQWAEYATGISFDSFVDEFVDALKAGERSAADLADNIEDMLRNAIIQGFKTRYLMDALEPFYDMFADFSGDEAGLTADEIERLRSELARIFEDAGKAWDLLGDLGIDFSSLGDGATALSGAIKGVSEETASIVAGQMNAMRINQAEHLTITRSALVHQANTAANTARMVELLEGTERQLNNINNGVTRTDPLRARGL